MLAVSADAHTGSTAWSDVSAVSVGNGGAPYAGDNKLLTTISPNGDGYRDRALIRFELNKRATVEVALAAVGRRKANGFKRTTTLGPGRHVVALEPPATMAPRTYIVRVRIRNAPWARLVGRPTSRRPVVRVLGIEASFRRESYAPRRMATLTVASDEPVLLLQVLRAGAAPVAEPFDEAVRGVPVGEPVAIRLRNRNKPRRVRLWVGDWPSGLYFARLSTPDGRAGYAPFVVRPDRLGLHRAAVVLPTYTWQAYNFRDGDGDGYGDTWYEGRTRDTPLGRAFGGRGLPPHFQKYDLGFLTWLQRSNHGVDFLTNSDLARLPRALDLTLFYDLIVFPGHHEYVTRREFDLVRRFRNRGGNLMFLSANNFYWRVEGRGRSLVRVKRWRQLGRPEAAFIGVQYVASDRGARQAPYIVRDVLQAPWLFEGTGLTTGSRFGRFGIEIDSTARSSPTQTKILAEIPRLLGRRTAQMTYYETRAGAKVFAAGAFTLAGNARQPLVARLLDNLWDRLEQP